MASETVRLHPRTHEKLKVLAEQSGEPMTEVLDRAVEALRRQRFVEECNAAYARLKDDPKAWAEEQAEREALDAANLDGLQEG